MYSDMSIRVIAASSSKRNQAKAFVSSVLPTPVGPRNINDPIGRWGSCNPARARRTAFTTALTASACPTTRSPRHASILLSFSRSASSIFATGTPVQRETTPAISSARTFSLTITASPIPTSKTCLNCKHKFGMILWVISPALS